MYRLVWLKVTLHTLVVAMLFFLAMKKEYLKVMNLYLTILVQLALRNPSHSPLADKYLGIFCIIFKTFDNLYEFTWCSFCESPTKSQAHTVVNCLAQGHLSINHLVMLPFKMLWCSLSMLFMLEATTEISMQLLGHEDVSDRIIIKKYASFLYFFR